MRDNFFYLTDSTDAIYLENTTNAIIEGNVFFSDSAAAGKVECVSFGQNVYNVFLNGNHVLNPKTTMMNYDLAGLPINDVTVTQTSTQGGFGGDLAVGGNVFADSTVAMTGFKMPTGASNGYVLTADDSGNGTWQSVSVSAPDSDWTISGSDMYSAVSGNVGIGTTIPKTLLHLSAGPPVLMFQNTSLANSGLSIKAQDSRLIFSSRQDNGSLYQDLMELTRDGNVGIRTNEYGGGYPVLSLRNVTTAPSGALSSAALFYATGGEMWVMDSGGNTTQLSPHDAETGEWIFYSKNVNTGRVVRVDMEKLVKAVERLTGEQFMVEMWE
jgi:hypothetical protein